MDEQTGSQVAQDAAEERVDLFRRALGPFVVAAENTRMAMIFTDATMERHPVVFANDSFLSLTGFRREDILGHGIAYLLKDVTDQSTLSAIETALGTGESGTWEAQCRRADGGEYLATVFLSPVPDGQGVIRQHFLCFVEVSGRIERLLGQREEFKALYEQAPGFIAALEGSEHRFTFANASFKRLVGRDDLIGARMVDLFPDMIEQGFIALLDRVFQAGQPFVGNALPIRFPGTGGGSRLAYINFVFQPVRDPGDVITGLFVEGYDVTAERLAAEQLSLLQGEVTHASRVNAMGMMAATLAHELNQPLTAISNYAAGSFRMVEGGRDHAEALGEALRAIEEAAQRAGHIIRNVRELTKRGETPKTQFKLKLAVTECVRLVRAGSETFATLVERVPDDISVFGDKTQIQQVLINLLRNACDAVGSGPGGLVTVDASRRGNEVVIGVTDTGCGLSLEAAENIFTWTDSSKEGGTGLGLSISRTIVEAHGGKIWLERSDDSGSQFCFSVPAQDGSASVSKN
ncbi:MAG TPA: ATP-binding protein [Allosphingosinicella sp.]|jgi:two-component system sensor kinase FixL